MTNSEWNKLIKLAKVKNIPIWKAKYNRDKIVDILCKNFDLVPAEQLRAAQDNYKTYEQAYEKLLVATDKWLPIKE